MVKQTSSHPSLDDALGYALKRAHIQLSQHLAKQLSALHLSTSQFYALMLIQRYDGACQAEVARLMGIDAPQIVPLLHKMEERGLIHKTREQGDKRFHYLHTTAAGVLVIQQISPIAKASDLFATSSLTELERHSLLRLLQKIKC